MTSSRRRVHGGDMTATLRGLVTVFFLALPFATDASDPELLIDRLEDIPSSETHVYRLLDDTGRNMDCLKVFQPKGETRGGVYGLYHTLQNGIFSIHLARSSDLLGWSHVTALDQHASQPTVRECDHGAYLVAYEKDAPNACWIRLRFYASLADLGEGKFESEFDIPRTLAPTAEGTPNIESVSMKDGKPGASEIRMRFHFFKDAHIDQLARGTLTDFKSWKAEASDKINLALSRQGWRGNLGDRDRFTWNDETFYLQEVQRVPGDWSSWRISLCDGQGMPHRTLSFQTPAGSKAFANPSATWITDAKGRKKLVVTLFLPAQGNAPAEAGSLLYVIDPSQAR
jgi:hypothetical protein